MPVYVDVNINDNSIGTIIISRRTPLDLTDQATIHDVVSQYSIRVNGHNVGTIQHRYGNGVWRLIAIATDYLARHPTYGQKFIAGVPQTRP